MKIKRHKVLLMLFICLFCVCATATMGSLSKKEKEEIQTATFKAAYNKTFTAVVEVFEEAGYFIDNADKEIGLITSEWKEGAISEGEEWAGMMFGMDIRRKVSATLKKIDEVTTKVKLRGIVQTRTGRGWSGTEDDMRIDVAKQSYKKFFDSILQKMEEQ